MYPKEVYDAKIGADRLAETPAQENKIQAIYIEIVKNGYIIRVHDRYQGETYVAALPTVVASHVTEILNRAAEAVPE